MSNLNLDSTAWLLHGLTGSTAGVLTLRNQRLSFTNDKGELVFDAPIGEVRDISFPWHLFGCGLSLQVSANNYRVSFSRPGNTAGGENWSHVVGGREECKQWKTALTS